jgi:hypothetical protein
MNPPLIMPISVLNRIDLYRETLRSNMRAKNLGQGRMGDGGQAASGVSSVNSSPTIVDESGGENAAGAGLEQFSFKTSHNILVLEGVDEDAEGADATMRDELIMLAHGDPMWMEELRKYLQKEEKEKEQMQEERKVRLAHWREGITSQPT